ncbi:class I SAM-dependent methyltransferase [Ancylobacter sp. IITR112]|uniref:class I SAM-dependent methyltransferase n=1 Tax=Ancylobacter sp. IITR112 TaxID=3138073 RepID=UPI00352AA702
MDFRNYVRSRVGKYRIGIEFGASYNPIVAKKDGFNVYIVDHADEASLREKYRDHPVDVTRIEPVDAIDDGGELTRLLPEGERFDYIIASHVFEHLPDPIRFLQRCTRALKPDGKLYLMLPDRRFTFDYFRPVSTTGAMVRAYLEKRTRHDPAHLFDHYSMSAERNGAGVWADLDGGVFSFTGTLEAGYAAATSLQTDYLDCHAWIFTPASFRNIIEELREINLIEMGEVEFYDSVGCEFFVVLSPNAPSNLLSRVERAERVVREASRIAT